MILLVSILKSNTALALHPASRASCRTSGQELTKMPSQMEHAMEGMMFTLHKFAGNKG